LPRAMPLALPIRGSGWKVMPGAQCQSRRGRGRVGAARIAAGREVLSRPWPGPQMPGPMWPPTSARAPWGHAVAAWQVTIAIALGRPGLRWGRMRPRLMPTLSVGAGRFLSPRGMCKAH
jgi:hypothetical protein